MYSVRSVTLPLESNPIMLRITRELKKLKAWEESSTSAAETIAIGLSGIADLYKCVGQFLSLPFIQQALALHQRDNSFVELLEGSKKILDVCSAARDIALQMKQASADLKASLDCESHHGLGLSNFRCSRKQIVKSTKKTLSSLRRAEGDSFGSSGAMLNGDQGVSAVIKVLTCVSIISISVLEAVLYFLATPASKCKPDGRFSFILKVTSRAKVACDGLGADQSKNELENLNFALHALSSNKGFNEESLRVACKRLDALQVGLEGIHNGAQSLLSQLAQTRAALLEIFSS